MTGLRARPWLPGVHAHEEAGDLTARLATRRPEPGFADTLRAAITAHPRFARAYLIAAALIVIAALAFGGTK